MTAKSRAQKRKPRRQAEVHPLPVARESGFDLDSPEWYLNRELTWLAFNRRVLHEAEDERTPLLERVKFLAIFSSNLDEFFMKRIGGLKQQIAAGGKTPAVDGRTPEQQVADCLEVIAEHRQVWKRVYGEVFAELAAHGIHLRRYKDLKAAQKKAMRQYFVDNVFPLLTPLAIDPGHPFPFISNLALNLLVTVRYPKGAADHLARVKVPVNSEVSPRFIRIDGEEDDYAFLAVEDLISNNLDLLFPGMEIVSNQLFRVTRNANVELDEEQADDLLEMIQAELRERHFAPIVRLEVTPDMDPVHRGMLAAELGLDEETDVFESAGLFSGRDLFEIAALNIQSLRYPVHKAIDHPRLAYDKRNIFHIIRNEGSLLLQHPYESFNTTVERFLATAAHDPKVLAIKMTLYRTAKNSKVVDLLVAAARNGKQVAVLVELKARFDEAANIGWARRLEEAGIHVTYGVVGLKTHTKVILVVRKDYSGLRRYVHVGTGNYHSGTARQYVDLGLLTCDPVIAQDVTELFNYLTGYSPPPRYRKILAAPNALKKPILEKITREIEHCKKGNPGLIQFKTNALEDADVARALYKASMAGVRVELIVRDTCRLRPGIPGLSDNICVVSIVGRFLEHARIFYFHNNGDEEYYIGSADLMRRNLEHRVELVAPVEDANLRQDLRIILDTQLEDQRSAWDMQPDGTYRQRTPKDPGAQGCQEFFIRLAETRLSAAAKHKQRSLRRKLEKRYRRNLGQSE